MKRLSTIFILALFTINSFHLFSQVSFSGILDSSVSFQAGAGDSPDFSYGIEEYANLRMMASLRDRALVYGSINLIAAAGNYAAYAKEMASLGTGSPLSSTSFVTGDSYIAAIELERLYFRINGDFADFDGGLFRIPFGYSQVWGPSDFLNPKNPLKPDARPRAVLGLGLSLYPLDSVKMLLFTATARDPFLRTGNGTITGFSIDKHWDRASVQALYSFEVQKEGPRWGIFRAGLSVKADVEIGLVMDALYTYSSEANTGLDGLSLSMGADYSFFNGDLIVIAEYLYNGETSSTALGYGGEFSNNNYLYTSLTWRFNDYTNASLALISGLDDVSFTPVITLNHDLFQGATLTLSAQIPLDRDVFTGNGKRGELGPMLPGYYALLTTGLKMRF
ncbi:MAG: hypothetical protein LBB72_06120 [Spirochaetaceae bacterium]|nr:hypothetical protein [Spirochaetaceae bacterium]